MINSQCHLGLEGEHGGRYCNESSTQLGPETECCGQLSILVKQPIISWYHLGLEGEHGGNCNESSILFGPETKCCGQLSLLF